MVVLTVATKSGRLLNDGAFRSVLRHDGHCLAADSAVVLNFASDNCTSVRPLPARSVLRHPRQPPGRSSSLRCAALRLDPGCGCRTSKTRRNGQKTVTRPKGMSVSSRWCRSRQDHGCLTLRHPFLSRRWCARSSRWLTGPRPPAATHPLARSPRDRPSRRTQSDCRGRPGSGHAGR